MDTKNPQKMNKMGGETDEELRRFPTLSQNKIIHCYCNETTMHRLFLTTLGSMSSDKKMRTWFDIEGVYVSPSEAETEIKQLLYQMAGVLNVEVDMGKKRVTVDYMESISKDSIAGKLKSKYSNVTTGDTAKYGHK